jgi:hypothetical protein
LTEFALYHINEEQKAEIARLREALAHVRDLADDFTDGVADGFVQISGIIDETLKENTKGKI